MTVTLPPPESFDDALNLLGLTFSARRGVVFCGRSGAGKSTAIRFLLERHAQFSHRRSEVHVLEELYDWRDARRLWPFFGHRRPVLVASHWPLWLHRLMAPWLGVHVVDLDAPRIKIERALARRAITASAPAIQHFCSRFGANYTDLQIVLERYPGMDFDQAWRRFLRECVVTESKPS